MVKRGAILYCFVKNLITLNYLTLNDHNFQIMKNDKVSRLKLQECALVLLAMVQ